MLFKQEFHDGLTRGATTLTFRRWARPRVKIGGRYRLSPSGVLEVDAIDEVTAGEVTNTEARRSGFRDRAALLDELGRASPLTASTNVFRVAFHYLPLPDPSNRRAQDRDLSAEDLHALSARLKRMDALSKHGPWTLSTLSLIAEHPHVAASQLAALVNRETRPFKADVRKLKNLGLTLSFDIGYELSPRGRAFLERHALTPS